MLPYTAIASRLITWYRYDHRDLPWRNTHDPYAIWVSEVMLQQTQVATVLLYYHRFMALFPTVEALATAHLDTVLKQWEGLGYYTRCRNLHKAAQTIMAQHAGQFPTTMAAIEALPGIGRSTAGAIATFAFNNPQPILDGNVKRVLSRLFAEPGTDAAWLNRLWEHSARLVTSTQDAYTLNQALMELGATHCSRTQPNCLLCPVNTLCQAHAQGITNDLPERVIRKATPHFTIAGAVIWKAGQVYIQQRPPDGLLGGLWEFPGGKQEPDETLPNTVLREVLEETGMHITVGQPFAPVHHAYSHFKITLHLYNADWVSGESTCQQSYQWVLPHDLDQYAFPKANKVIVEQLMLQAALPVV
jgi:A/G-specific adenine glycosylase